MNYKVNKLYKAFIYIILILFALSIVIPVGWVFVASVKQNSEFYGNPWTLPASVHIQNFVDAFNKARMGDYFLNSIIVTVTAIVLLLVLALAIGRRSRPPAQVQLPVEKRRLSRRTTAAAASILLLIPVTLFVGVYYLNNQRYGLVSMLVLLECMAPFFLVFEGRRPQARELVVIAVLCAISVAGRAAFFMLPQFKPVMAMTIISGVALGGESGFLVGALSMLVSNMLFSQGVWTPWQMFSMGIIGFLAGVLFRKGLLRRTRGSLCTFGAFCAIVIYGGIMNPASVLMWGGAEALTWKTLLTYYVTGFPVDCVHAAATVFFLWIAAEPMLEKLDRIKEKYGLLL